MEKIEILLTKKTYEKNPNTKTTYNLISNESEIISKEQYERIISPGWKKINKALGAKESTKKSYTPVGYVCTQLTSTSSCKQSKSVFEFKFNLIDKQ